MFEIIGDSFDFSKCLFNSSANLLSLLCLEGSIIYPKGILVFSVYMIILVLHTVTLVKRIYRVINLPAIIDQAICSWMWVGLTKATFKWCGSMSGVIFVVVVFPSSPWNKKVLKQRKQITSLFFFSYRSLMPV